MDQDGHSGQCFLRYSNPGHSINILGADHSLRFNMPVFAVAIIDFDNGGVGLFLQQMGAMDRATSSTKSLGYISEPSLRYNKFDDKCLSGVAP